MDDREKDMRWLWGEHPDLHAGALASDDTVHLRFVLDEDGNVVPELGGPAAAPATTSGVRTVRFYVPGLPIAQGSKVRTNYGMRESNDKKLKPWRATIATIAAREVGEIFHNPVTVMLKFTFPRPKAHYGSGRNAATVKLSAPHFHTVKPDIDKLQRAVFDALTSIVWRDDSQVCVVRAEKVYGDAAGVEITIREHD